MAIVKSKKQQLAECEKIIRHGIGTFFEVGNALKRIRDGKLYREAEGFKTFADYCEKRWGMSKTHANRQIQGAATVELLVDTNWCRLLTHESIARPLAKLLPEPDKLEAAWSEAVSTAPLTSAGQPIVTAKYVEAVVKRYIDNEPNDDAPVSPTCTVGDLHQLVRDGKTYGNIYCDPPWAYSNQATRAATDNHYETLSVDWLCDPANMPIEALAMEDAHLHLWTTNAFLFEAKRIIEAWGFTYKSCFVWVKTQMGIGNYWRVSHEFLLLGVRGRASFADKSLMSWGEYPRTKHSSKPHQVQAMVERASPTPRLELFARKVTPGWTCWGDEVSRDLLSMEVASV